MTNPLFRQKWIDKAGSVREVILQLDLEEDVVLDGYANETFVDGSSKHSIFSEILAGVPSSSTVQYLVDRLTDGFGHLRGDRSGAEYGADLVLGWLVEDSFRVWAIAAGISSELAGHDRNREFLKPGKISAASDFLIGNQEPRKLELATDYNGHWKKYDKYDLRDSKFEKLCQESALLFLIDVANSKGAVLDLGTPELFEVSKTEFHFIYKKPAYTIHGVRDLLLPIPEAMVQLKQLVS
jgi:hypothetical protein